MTIQSIGVPLVQVSEPQLRALRAQLEQALIDILSTEASIQPGDISVRDLAAAAGGPTGTLYQCFEDKDAVLQALRALEVVANIEDVHRTRPADFHRFGDLTETESIEDTMPYE